MNLELRTEYWEDRVISRVCIYMLAAVIDGRLRRLARISGVGTRKEPTLGAKFVRRPG